MDQNGYLTVGEVAKEYKLYRAKLAKWIKDGNLPYIQSGRDFRVKYVKREDVERLLGYQHVPNEAEGAPTAPSAMQETAPTLEELLAKPLNDLTEAEAQRLLALDPNDWSAPTLPASKRDYLEARFRRY